MALKNVYTFRTRPSLLLSAAHPAHSPECTVRYLYPGRLHISCLVCQRAFYLHTRRSPMGIGAAVPCIRPGRHHPVLCLQVVCAIQIHTSREEVVKIYLTTSPSSG